MPLDTNFVFLYFSRNRYLARLGSDKLTLFNLVHGSHLIKLVTHSFDDGQTLVLRSTVNQLPDVKDILGVLTPLKLLWLADLVVSSVQLFTEDSV